MHGFGNLIIDIDEIVEAIDAGVISIMTVHNSLFPSFVLHEQQYKHQHSWSLGMTSSCSSSVVLFGLPESLMHTKCHREALGFRLLHYR